MILGILYGVVGLLVWVAFAVWLVVERGFAMDDGEEMFTTLGLSFFAGVAWPLTLVIGGVAWLVVRGADWLESRE